MSNKRTDTKIAMSFFDVIGCIFGFLFLIEGLYTNNYMDLIIGLMGFIYCIIHLYLLITDRTGVDDEYYKENK